MLTTKAFYLPLLIAATAFAAPALPSSPALAISPRSITPDGTTPANLRRFTISISEYCSASTLHARAWASDGLASHPLDFQGAVQKLPVALHSEMLFSPYDYEKHAFGMEYKGCEWSSRGGGPCGWCEGRMWSGEELDCESGGVQKVSWGVCHYVDGDVQDLNGDTIAARDAVDEPPTVGEALHEYVQAPEIHQRSGENDARDLPVPPTPSNPLESMTFDLASATITARPEYTDNLQPPTRSSNEILHLAASTVTLKPTIIETVLPGAHPPIISIILPFRIQLWEYCTVAGAHLAAGMYSNGNLRSALDLSPGLTMSVKHFIPGYANLEVGPYDFAKGALRFWYQGCEWADYETWKSCGECRAAPWSGDPVECGGGAMVVRLREIECSVLLGTKPVVGVDGG